MLELAKFAKHHIPEEHELDDQDFVEKRINVLGSMGITSALVGNNKVGKGFRSLEENFVLFLPFLSLLFIFKWRVGHAQDLLIFLLKQRLLRLHFYLMCS